MSDHQSVSEATVIDSSYVNLLKQVDNAIDAYLAENPLYKVSTRVIVSVTDDAGNLTSVKHEVERGNSNVPNHTEDFATLIKMRPDDIQARIDCSIALMSNGNYDAAVEQAREAVRLQPDNPRSHIALWRALRAASHNEQAHPAIMEALRILENNDLQVRMDNATFEIDTREAFSQWLYLLGELDEAREQTRSAIALAERTGMIERLDWLNRQLSLMNESPSQLDLL